VEAQIVITLVARDRPGLVEQVASIVTRHGGNWLESRMARLGGQFAGILRATLPADRESAFKSAIEKLSAAGIHAHIQKDEPPPDEPADQLAEFKLVGQDRPGIVRQISEVFARFGVNVEELTTECSSAPMSGEVLFHADALVRIPSTCPPADLKSALERIAADMMVDASLKPVDQAPCPFPGLTS
jgi:glycine cleavage system regulatory protein